ncbi:MAG: hypothetical protein OEQ25_06995 [Gammaproteobacteria bacterium]|nr:hypothetical protein [Gammaproteobacteria bacterium]MDH3506872.1 hypothetical protein [Gammaproteobacteria bacterium]
MRHITTATLFALACALAQPASAQLEDKPVLMTKAPFHVPMFSNDYVTMLSINIPPGRDTGFHTHFADSTTVNFSPAIRTNQVYDSPEISAPSVGQPVPGRVSFNNVTENGQYTHKASNVGPTPFRGISALLKDREMAGPPVSDRSDVAGYAGVLDNKRVRAWRVILEPGEMTGQITQTAPGWRVYVRGGVLDELVPGSAPRGMAVADGDFMWQDAGQTRAVKNTGSTVIEFVEYELK